MLIKFINNLLPARYRNNKGLVSAGAGVEGGYSSSKSRTTYDPYAWNQNPDYAEASGARTLLWDKLQGFGGQPSYGAIAPDWADIWQQTQDRIRQHYSGTATQPGAMDQVKASAARRGVSESPALETEMTKLLVEQGGQLGQASSQQALAQSQFGEEGRMQWLNMLFQMAGINPAGMWQPTGTTNKSSEWNVGGNANVGYTPS